VGVKAAECAISPSDRRVDEVGMEAAKCNFTELTLGLTTLQVDSLFNSSVLATGMNQGRRTTTARQ